MTDAKIKRLAIQMERIEEQMKIQNVLSNTISEEQAAVLLGISTKTLRNKVSTGDIDGFYTTSPINGERFYNRAQIMGIQL